MPRPNPKTYPFNYVVHEDDASTNFATYVDAEEYVKATYPLGVHEELWTSDSGSKLKELPWSEFEDPHKYVWISKQTADDFSQLMDLFRADKIDEAKTFLTDLGVEFDSTNFEKFDQLARFVFKHTVCAIERRRDAYETAMVEFEAQRQDEFERDS